MRLVPHRLQGVSGRVGIMQPFSVFRPRVYTRQRHRALLRRSVHRVRQVLDVGIETTVLPGAVRSLSTCSLERSGLDATLEAGEFGLTGFFNHMREPVLRVR